MMGHRPDELAMRRRQLLLKSARLRADLAADQRYLVQSVSGFDKYVAIARGLAKPAMFAGVALLLLRVLRRRRPAAGFAMRALAWVSLARRMLALVYLTGAFMRLRSRQSALESGRVEPLRP
jgi:hypothetical protein